MTDNIRLIVVHEVPGRLRARCPGLRNNPDLAPHLEMLARELPGLADLSIRPTTESVVLRYDLEDTSPETFYSGLRSRLEVMRSPAAPIIDEPIGAQLSRELRRWWDQADQQVLQATRGVLDVRSSVPWVLAFLALRQIALDPNLPALPWYVALYHSIQAIRRYPPASSSPSPSLADEE